MAWGRTTTADDMANWTARHQPDRLSGRVAIVTGGSSGIGLRCVKALATHGVQVVVPARDVTKAETALRGLPDVAIQPMDLMGAGSISDFIAWFAGNHDHLDYLIGCGGIMAPPLRRDAKGHESQFSTNHLGHFQLATGLAPLLAAGTGHPRLVLVSSRAQRAAGNLTGQAQIGIDGMVQADAAEPGAVAGINFGDPDWVSTPYEPMLAYAQSKTANVLTAVEFDRRWRDRGVRAFAVHPGLVPGSDLGRGHATPPIVHRVLGNPVGVAAVNAIRRVARQVRGGGDLFKTPAQGAGTVLWAALSPELDDRGGVYCEDCHIAPVVDDPASPSGVLPWAVDPGKARRLWQLSEAMIGQPRQTVGGG